MNTDYWGGSEEQWFSLAKYFQSKNHKVSCLVYKWKEKSKKLNLLEEQGAKLMLIPNYGRQKKTIFQKISFELVTRNIQYFFIKLFDFKKYDYVIVNQGGFMEVANNPWKLVYKKLHKYCLTFHNYYDEFNFEPKKAAVLKAWIANAHFVSGDANRIKNVLERQLEIEFKNFNAVPNPLTIDKPIGLTPFPTLLNGNFLLVMMAQLDVSRKAQDNLIKAFATEEWKARNLVVELYGFGKDYNYLEQLISENKLEQKIFLRGYTRNVEAVFDKAHLCLQITHIDALPISVIEAMSKSRALIVSDVGDMPLWIRNNENGWVCKDASISEISRVLEVAWNNHEKWETMGQKSFEIFKEKFPKNVDEIFYELIIN